METPRKASTHTPTVSEAKRKLAQALGRPLPKSHHPLGTSALGGDATRMIRDPRARYPHLFQFYCPQCGVAKRLPFSPQPGARHFFQVGLTSLLLMIALWPWWGLKGAVVFLPLWIAFEVIYRVRVRARMRCTQCGFDPFLYMTDIGRARAEMVEHWRKLYEERGLKYPPENKPWWSPEEKDKPPESAGEVPAGQAGASAPRSKG